MNHSEEKTYSLGISDLSVIWCDEFDNFFRSNKITYDILGKATDEIMCPWFQMIDGMQVYQSLLRFFNTATFAAKKNMGEEHQTNLKACNTIYDVVYFCPTLSSGEMDLRYDWQWRFFSYWQNTYVNKLNFKCSYTEFLKDSDKSEPDTCWCESPVMVDGMTQLDLRCRDQFDQTKTIGETKTTPEYVSGSAKTGILTTGYDQFICGISVATDPDK